MHELRAATMMFTLALFFSMPVFGASSSIATASHSGGGVTVKVTYRAPQPPNDLGFEVLMDAKKVNLDDYDLQKLALLRDASGKTYEPLKVEAKGSGRHRDATIFFPQPAGGAQQVELIIKEVGGVKERVFHFKIS